jgi:hypothetical protein
MDLIDDNELSRLRAQKGVGILYVWRQLVLPACCLTLYFRFRHLSLLLG